MVVRTIVVGDVHGCLEELDELLARLQHRKGEDRLVLAGDLVDRGPDPVGVVRRARELGALGVLGNHEEKHLRFAKHEALVRSRPGYTNPMQAFSPERRREHEALSARDLDYLRSLPVYLRLDARWLVVHGGFLPGRPIDRQKPGMVVRLRRVDGKGASVSLGSEGPDAVPWATRWPGPESVIYGHEVHDLANPRRDEPRPGVVCHGIDTGCCFGGRLTALVLPGEELVQVQARRAYSPFQRGEDE
jgi:bis(5'-nucleosyl)-tetraphosphatase (symmetrical)